MKLSKSRLSRYSLLRHKKYRDREGLFIVQGKKAFEDTKDFFEIEDIIEDADDIRKITTLENPPDIVVVYRKPQQTEKMLKTGTEEFTLVLDGIQDPGNLGTIIRTAHWFGVTKIFCSLDTVDVYNPKAVLATMGSIARVKVVYCDLKLLFDMNQGIPVYGLLLEGHDIFEEKEFPPGMILMGSEGHGPGKTALSRISRPLTIPPADRSNRPDSLNVAIATAVTLSQILK